MDIGNQNQRSEATTARRTFHRLKWTIFAVTGAEKEVVVKYLEVKVKVWS